jgi:NAD+ synthase (glutamine-hydrolysing)
MPPANGFARVAVAVPRMRVGEPVFNADKTVALAHQAADDGAVLVAFPELGLSGYSNEDLFGQSALLDASLTALGTVAAGTSDLACALVVGVPLVAEGRLFNCAAVVEGGRVLGVAPKSYLPNYREFYEPRQFAAARAALHPTLPLFGEEVPFGADLLFRFPHVPGLTVHVEICEDVWVPLPPSTFAAMAGATVLVNLSASNITIGKDAYREELCRSQSARLMASYLYTSAGYGESTTDLAWDGHALIYEHGDKLAETHRFANADDIAVADVDLELLAQERMRMGSYTDCATDHRDALRRFRAIEVGSEPPRRTGRLRRRIERFPFVPADSHELDDRCAEAFRIQVQGLAMRMESTGIENLVIGVSGGLDSTHALLVAVRAMDLLGLPRTNVFGYSLPGFATSRSTRANALALMDALGITAGEIDIRPSSQQMLADLGHPAATGEPVYDVTYENVQAGERTSHLFRLANHHRALVVGTGDLSELALGWATFGVGDHMSHYNVNASVPKTLIAFLIRWVAANEDLAPGASDTLLAIAETKISPELVPGEEGADEPSQSTEDTIGPYELHDFFLYHLTRFGFRPSKILALADEAWSDPAVGRWPSLIPEDRRNGYDLATIAGWLRVFLERFFANQFKRSTLPNGPKIGSGGSLSPRGDWRAPSDVSAAVWLAELDACLAELRDGPPPGR